MSDTRTSFPIRRSTRSTLGSPITGTSLGPWPRSPQATQFCARNPWPSVSEKQTRSSPPSMQRVDWWWRCWYLWNPRIKKVRSLLGEGRVGTVRHLEATFCSAGSVGGYRFDAALGGGALYDLGCYVVSAALWAFGAAPLSIEASCRLGSTGVDEEAHAVLRFANGEAILKVAFTGFEEKLRIEGDNGTLEVPDSPFTSAGDTAGRILIESSTRAEFSVRQDGRVPDHDRGGLVSAIRRRWLGVSARGYPRTCAVVVEAWRRSAASDARPVEIETGHRR